MRVKLNLPNGAKNFEHFIIYIISFFYRTQYNISYENPLLLLPSPQHLSPNQLRELLQKSPQPQQSKWIGAESRWLRKLSHHIPQHQLQLPLKYTLLSDPKSLRTSLHRYSDLQSHTEWLLQHVDDPIYAKIHPLQPTSQYYLHPQQIEGIVRK